MPTPNKCCEKYIYRHCEGGYKTPLDNDSHWKCMGYGDEGDCGCTCHSQTPDEKIVNTMMNQIKN